MIRIGFGIVLALLLVGIRPVRAASRSAEEAAAVVQGWRTLTIQPLETMLGTGIRRVETFSDENGMPMYYVVYLTPSGFVIVPAEDRVEPILCFAAAGVYEPGLDNPLGALVSQDVPSRIAAVQKLAAPEIIDMDAVKKTQAKWQAFTQIAQAEMENSQDLGVSSISDVWVAPLVQSRWSQSSECSNLCYNYYTPNNYVCGCVATALAQVLRFHQHPVSGIGVHEFTIGIDGVSESAFTRGGDGSGGPYNWGLMMLDPDCSITAAQREAIGALCYDAGLSVNMNYASGGSGADTLRTKNALEDTFGYSNAVKAHNSGSDLGSPLNGMINPNLDFGNPVILGITGAGGHAIVADGYGYDSTTLYHHLNMGWAGSSDLWYDLPDIQSFDSVYKCVYNIYITGSGEIISGRITNQLGNPIPGVDVTATRTGGGVYSTTTNNQGIYALEKIPSGSTYNVVAVKVGYAFINQSVSTGTSTDYANTSGNVWGVDFVDTEPSPPIALDDTIAVQSGTATNIELKAIDEGYPDPPGALEYIITTLPLYGSLTDPEAGAIISVPYTLANRGKQVVYTPRPHVPDADSFSFKAHDGGVPPIGGESNTGTITLAIYNVIYATNLDNPPGTIWTFDPGSAPYRWEWGTPLGSGGEYGNPDPTSGYTGTNVIGYNLAGDYPPFITAVEWATLGPIDCSSCRDVTLRFYRWLNVESPEYDHAYIEVSNGSNWTQIWSNTSEITDSSWHLQTFDISSIADEQATVFVRWGMGPTDDIWQYSGWNIDDIEIRGALITTAPPAPSDLEAVQKTAHSITWTWTDNSDSETGFRGLAVQEIEQWEAGAGETEHEESSLTANMPYTRSVVSYNSYGRSDPNLCEATIWTEASKPDVSCDRGTENPAWPVGTEFTFTNLAGFGTGGVAYYRYAWNQNAVYICGPSDPHWSGSTLSASGSSAGPWYLHVVSCNDNDESASAVTFGPYLVLDGPWLHAEPEYTNGLCNTVRWDAVAGADEYLAECAEDPDFALIIADSDWQSETDHTFCNLESGRTYYYRVQSRNLPATEHWLQTSQNDFAANLPDQISVDKYPGDAVLEPNQLKLFSDDFEDGNIEGWDIGTGAYSYRGVSDTAAVGAYSITLEGGSGHINGVSYDLDSMQPDTVSFYVRSGSTDLTDGYFVLGCGGIDNQTAVFFYMRYDGQMGIYDGVSRWTVSYDNDTWYKICFDFDWGAQQVDYYVNDSLVQSEIPFRGSSVPSLTRLYLYNYDESEAWWDEIEFHGGSGSGYVWSGQMTTRPIVLPAAGEWHMLDYDATTPTNTNLIVDVLDASDDSVILSDVSSGIDLNSVGVSALKLRASLSTADAGVTPALHAWSLGYSDTSQLCVSGWSNVESSYQCDTPGDFEPDCDVDVADLNYLLSHWLDAPCDDSSGDGSDWCWGADLNRDGKVDLGDVQVLGLHWLEDWKP